MNWQDFNAAVQNAKDDIQRGDDAAQRLAKLLVGRLRSAGVNGHTLCELKREMRDFDMVTKKWKRSS